MLVSILGEEWTMSSPPPLTCVIIVQSLNRVWLFVTPWTSACQASLSITISQSLLKVMSIEAVVLSNQLIFCCPLLLLSLIFPSIRVFSSSIGLLKLTGEKTSSFPRSTFLIAFLIFVKGISPVAQARNLKLFLIPLSLLYPLSITIVIFTFKIRPESATSYNLHHCGPSHHHLYWQEPLIWSSSYVHHPVVCSQHRAGQGAF